MGVNGLLNVVLYMWFQVNCYFLQGGYREKMLFFDVLSMRGCFARIARR